MHRTSASLNLTSGIRVACHKLSVSFHSERTRIRALHDVSLEAHYGEFVSVVGPSGCGKTTLLRTVAGFLQADGGTVEHSVSHVRGLMVYQENSLFPWMTVLENACFGLQSQGVPREERERRALPLLHRFGFEGRERAWPNQLSVGMKQRVAVIRSFLSNPDLLLMDEPFAALDCQMRRTLQEELLELWEQDHRTVVFVTHDVDEAILLSDRVAVLSSQPGTVVAEFRIPFERPRETGLTLSEEFLLIKRQIYANLGIRSKDPIHAG
jgi:NitT/TauT family transport system ATP-binding protein